MSTPAMPDPSRQADIAFVIRQLSNHVRREEVMQALMARHGYTWTEAGRIVDEIATTYQGQIATRQLPLLLYLGITTFIGGCVLLLYCSYRLLFHMPFNPWALRNLVVGLGSGFVMVIGSAIGLVQALIAASR